MDNTATTSPLTTRAAASLPVLLTSLLAGVLVVVAAWVVSPAAGVAGHPETSGLDAPLATALEVAAEDAARDGVVLTVTSGRRSAEHQQELWEDGLREHGSAEEARRWVLPPDESRHVTGEAVDLARPGAEWLAEHGWAYGLCRTYANEWWHFELLTAPGGSCPTPRPDAGG